MRLVNCYEVLDSPAILYRLLAEREPHVNISHTKMPSPDEHMDFFCSRPYDFWALIEEDGSYIGSVYLTTKNEIGVFVCADQRHKGYGTQAVKLLLQLPTIRGFRANIAPTNTASMAFFAKLGFKPMQITYALDRNDSR